MLSPVRPPSSPATAIIDKTKNNLDLWDGAHLSCPSKAGLRNRIWLILLRSCVGVISEPWPRRDVNLSPPTTYQPISNWNNVKWQPWSALTVHLLLDSPLHFLNSPDLLIHADAACTPPAEEILREKLYHHQHSRVRNWVRAFITQLMGSKNYLARIFVSCWAAVHEL